MTETRFCQSVDAIVALLQAQGLTVWDGPTLSGEFRDCVYIGFDGDYSDTGEETAAEVSQTWASAIGQKARDEAMSIAGAVLASSGNDLTTWKPLRDTAFAILQTIGQALRADPSLGLPAPSVAELGDWTYYQETYENGYVARIRFTIHHKTRV